MDPHRDTEFFYLGGSHASVRAQVLEALQRRESPIVLTGESGTGKTTLCRLLPEFLSMPAFFSEIADPSVTAEDLLKQILVDFGMISRAAAARPEATSAGLATISYDDLVLTLRRFVEVTLPARARAVVVIDNAHELRPRVLMKLRKLANLTTPRAPLSALSQGGFRALQLILVGQPHLDSLLAEGQWGQAEQPVACRCHLQPLENDEVAPYVRHRQQHRRQHDRRGITGDDRNHHELDAMADALDDSVRLDMTSSAMRLLTRLSGGVPRAINLISDQAAAIAAERQIGRVDRRLVMQGAEQLGLAIPGIKLLAGIRRPGFPAMIAMGLTTATVVLAALFISLPSRSTRPKGADSRDAPSKSAQSNVPASARAGEPAPQASPRSSTPSSITPPIVDRLEAADSFLVTVASFKGPQRAGEVVDQLKRKGLPAFARQGTGWFVVLVGPYVSREEADDVRRQIGSAGYADSHIEKQSAAGPRS